MFKLADLGARDILSLAAATFTFLTLYQYLFTFRYWKKRNIKGPTPWPMVGNAIDVFFGNKYKMAIEWPEKYGKTFGIFQGKEPRIMVGDPEIVQQICIKDFDVFPNHELRDFYNKYEWGFLFNQRDNHWKKVRALMSPTFTSGKIKRMFRLLDTCVDDLVDCFKEQFSGDSPVVVDVKEIYQQYTMDAVATCCYGLKLERTGSGKKGSIRAEFVKMASQFFYLSMVRLLLVMLTPKFLLKTLGFQMIPDDKMQPLAKLAQGVIDNRRKVDRKFDDYLQLLMEARLDDQLELDEMDQQENHHAGLTDETLLRDQKKMLDAINDSTDKKVTLTDMEIISSAMLLLSVGLETTATLLTHCSYALAFHQQIQDRLYDELKSISEFDEAKRRHRFNYESITACHYLDAVVSETLRLLAPASAIDRQANEDYFIEKYNLTIPKKGCLFLNVYGIHLDPDYWPEPMKFDPDRFMPENRESIKPGTYLPFGIGPRHCVGMRFSLTETKLALAKILMKFKMTPAPNCSFPPVLSRRPGLTAIRDPCVKLSLRE